MAEWKRYTTNASDNQGFEQDLSTPRKPINLLAKAVALLSRREYSEVELRQRLQRYTEDKQQIDETIARLQKENWQSDERFLENFVSARQSRWGNQKILHALKTHHLEAEAISSLKEQLKETELDRAKGVWERKYNGIKAETMQEKAKQMRFLANRGFSSTVIRKIVF